MKSGEIQKMSEKEFVPLFYRPGGKMYIILVAFLIALGVGFFLFYSSSQLPLSENRQAFKKNGLWGYKDAEGQIVIPAQYQSAATFRNGFAIVSQNSKYGTIGIDGRILSPIRFDEIFDEILEIEVRPVLVGIKKSILMPNGELLFDPTYASFKNSNNHTRDPNRIEPLSVTLGSRNIVIGKNAKILFDKDNSSNLSIDYDGSFTVSFLHGEKQNVAQYSQTGELIFQTDKFDSLKSSNYQVPGNFFIVTKNGKSSLYNQATDTVLLPWGEGKISTGFDDFHKKGSIHRESDKADILYSYEGKEIASHHDISRAEQDGMRRIQCFKSSRFGLISDFGKMLIPCVADDIIWDFNEKAVKIHGESYVFENGEAKKFSNVEGFILDIKKNTCLKKSKKGGNSSSPRLVYSEFQNTTPEKGCVRANVYSSDYKQGSFSVKFTNENPYPVKINANVLSMVLEGRYSPDTLFCKRYLSDKVVLIKPNDTETASFSGGCKQQIGWLRRYAFVGGNVLKVEKVDMSAFNTARTERNSFSHNNKSQSRALCSRFASLIFESNGLAENPSSLQVVSSKNVSINVNSNNSASLSALSGDCVGGQYEFSFVVNTGLRQDSQKHYSGRFSIPKDAESCNVSVSDGYSNASCF